MKKRPVNLGRSDENVADQYPNVFDGLQKDAAQNSWDARTTKKGKEWKLLFHYLHDRHTLVLEDFGTTGMNKEKWDNYQSLWYTSKAEEDALGARGQGKFLFHYFSKDKLVLTETIDENGKYRFSYGTTEEWDDVGKTLNDFIPGARPLDHQGTRIWITNVKEELREELLDYRTFMKYIAATWWEVMQNFGVIFVVNFDEVERQVPSPIFPAPDKESTSESEKIKDFGRVRNLVIRYSKEEVPEELRGIAVQRGGMTILRIQAIAEENIKNRIYGWCNFDDELETELKACEQPNHFGFNNKKAWNHVREFIRGRLSEFLLKITPTKEKTEVASEVLQKAVKLVNDLVGEYAPELLTGTTKDPPPPPLPKPPVRIDVFRPNQRKFEYNETLLIYCEVANETSEDKDLSLAVHIKHNQGIEKFRVRYNLNISKSSRKRIDIPLIDFDEKKDKAGKYSAQGMLSTENEHNTHEKNFTFYLHEEPPVPPPGPGGGRSFITGFEFTLGKKSDGTMLVFAKWRTLPIETSRKGILHVIWDHPDFVRTRELAGKREKNRETLLYCARCSIDEAFRKLLELRQADNRLDPDEILRIRNTCDEMIYEAVLRTE